MAINLAGDSRQAQQEQSNILRTRFKAPASEPEPTRPASAPAQPDGWLDWALSALDNHAALIALLALTVIGIMLICIRMDSKEIAERATVTQESR